jgi:hypothetical protein
MLDDIPSISISESDGYGGIIPKKIITAPSLMCSQSIVLILS